MKKEAIKEYLIINGEVHKTEETDIFDKIEKPPIYEVIRIIDGVPLFFEDHIKRMFDSARIIDFKISRNEDDIRKDIKTLILKNKIDRLNVKLVNVDIDKMGRVFLAYNIESFYPQQEYYIKGIHTTLFHHERENPNAKVLVSSFKEEVARVLKEKEAFEICLKKIAEHGLDMKLVDVEYNFEGSKIMFFFTSDGRVDFR